jgi:hypothetical protein
MDHLATGNPVYDSSRLRYTAASPITFEMLRVGNDIETFLTLTRFRIKERDKVKVHFTTTSGSFEDFASVHEGNMRARLSQEATEKIIASLRDGEKVVILLDGFEQTLEPTKFSQVFAEFLGERSFYETLLRGGL